MNKVKRNILLNPGPATTTDTVKLAQVVPDICPRETEFGEVMEFISEKLTGFVGNSSDYTTVLFGGSGTAAVESILSSVVGEGTILIINNGAYGKRMCEIAGVYRLKYIEFHSSAHLALDLSKLEQIIINSPDPFTHLAVVHNETTTGLLNDIDAIGKLCSEHGIKLIVDAMSSYGAIPIDMKKINISYLAASSNKNLQGIAGVGFVIARINELEATKTIPAKSFYLNLYSQYKYFMETKQLRFTPPVQVVYALKQAIIELESEGVENRFKRYTQTWETLMKGISRLGLASLVELEYQSKIITAIAEPVTASYNFNEMHDFLYQNGFTIYPGKISGQNTFRIANIGDITFRDMEQFISLLEQYLLNIGFLPNPESQLEPLEHEKKGFQPEESL
ncbi:2-aminoethylphosphonate-pyruvate transaminase [Bacillus sp. OV322]|uniref:2-aminoethylphosphonate aminotransferase n=1 Tax=Bacillus sp. OV322 TaxID=1882764 RepID=UPI0008ECF88C|nr:2-aminoethylphosphonate--pyruvate transaminase [Bacillus sp. OV322]SFC10158.1 2-aminoethylphosphonate-pyruvate transaminase [Bacillus sp. OV322]